MRNTRKANVAMMRKEAKGDTAPMTSDLHSEPSHSYSNMNHGQQAKGSIELDRKTCEHYENRDKAIICEANVVVYFDIKEDENLLVIIDGSEIEPRVA